MCFTKLRFIKTADYFLKFILKRVGIKITYTLFFVKNKILNDTLKILKI